MELKPRVGDRVLCDSADALMERFAVGTVAELAATNDECWVDLDRRSHLGRVRFRFDELKVLDREPVEWPEGWHKHDDTLVLHEASDIAFDKLDLTWVLESGPDMLARFDELMGES